MLREYAGPLPAAESEGGPLVLLLLNLGSPLWVRLQCDGGWVSAMRMTSTLIL